MGQPRGLDETVLKATDLPLASVPSSAIHGHRTLLSLESMHESVPILYSTAFLHFRRSRLSRQNREELPGINVDPPLRGFRRMDSFPGSD